MASRRKGRILAFQALYAWEASGSHVSTLLDLGWLEPEKKAALDEASRAFTNSLIAGTLENIESVDSMIKGNLRNWDFDRLSKVDLAILRVSAYSLLFQKDIPATITIDEAVELAKEFGTDDSYKFINGVLDGIMRKGADIGPA
jgi:transcription antitermination protein NusB